MLHSSFFPGKKKKTFVLLTKYYASDIKTNIHYSFCAGYSVRSEIPDRRYFYAEQCPTLKLVLAFKICKI